MDVTVRCIVECNQPTPQWPVGKIIRSTGDIIEQSDMRLEVEVEDLWTQSSAVACYGYNVILCSSCFLFLVESVSHVVVVACSR